MHTAWRRQLLRRWQHQVNFRNTSGYHELSAPPASSVIGAARLPVSGRCFSSAATAAGDGDRNDASGRKGTSPSRPRPKASSRWGNQRRSNRLEDDVYTRRPSTMQRLESLQPFDAADNLRVIEKSMGTTHNNNSSSSSQQRKKRASSLPKRPLKWSRNGHLIPEQYRNSNTMPVKTTNPQTTAEIRSRISSCKTIHETVQVAHGYLNNISLTPVATAAFWKKLSHISERSHLPQHANGKNDNHEEMKNQLKELFQHTLKYGLDDYSTTDLGNLAQACSSIVKGSPRDRRKWLPHHDVMYDLLVKKNKNYDNDNDAPALFWEKIQEQTVAQIDSFVPSKLASVALAFAAMTDPMYREGNALNVAPFFQSLNKTFNKRRGEFNSKHVGNLAWACMTCRRRMPSLLSDFSEEFVSRRNKEQEASRDETMDKDVEDALTPAILTHWATSYAKAEHEDVELFQSIANASIPMLRDEFDSRNFSNLAYACAVAGVVPATEDGSSNLFDKIAEAAIPKAADFKPLHIANTLWAYAKVGHASPELFDALAGVAMPRLKEFSAQQLANLAWAQSKFPSLSHDALFDRIAEEVVSRGLEQFTSQGLAMLAHSFATVGHARSDPFWESLDRAATTRVSELGPIECSQIAWSMATIERPSNDLFNGIESIVTSKMNQFKPQGLSNIAWAFVMLGHNSPEFYEAIAKRSMRKMHDFTPSDKVMLALAYSRIESHSRPSCHEELFDRIASSAESQLDKFTALDLFNLVMSYERAGYRHQSEPWMEAIAKEIIRRPEAFSPQLIVGIAWAYSTMGVRIPALFRVLAGECIIHCDKLTTKQVASLAWSFASIGAFDRQLLGALADSSDGRWQEFDATSLATMSWAYTTAQEDRPGLFEGITNAAIEKSDEFGPQGISMILWACATSGHMDQRLFDSLAPSASACLCEMSSQSLANLAWAYSVANVDEALLFGAKSANADEASSFGVKSNFTDIAVEKIDKFDSEGLSQLHQWNLWQKEMGNYGSLLPAHLEKRCYDNFTKQPFRSSLMQNDVMSELISMGFRVEEEALTQSGYRLDALADLNGKKIGVEVDGPHHFVGRKPTGNTILKHRQVSKLDGIPVVSLPYWELDGLESSEDKQRYLWAKLDIRA